MQNADNQCELKTGVPIIKWNTCNKKKPQNFRLKAFNRDLGEDRTLDPLIKSQLLYRLSYQVIFLPGCKYTALSELTNRFLLIH
jgi:hypothetical protein